MMYGRFGPSGCGRSTVIAVADPVSVGKVKKPAKDKPAKDKDKDK